MKRLFNICLVIALHAIVFTSCDLIFPYSLEDAPAEPIAEPDLLDGAFSVDTNKFVQFSPGNLQYRASTDEWRFAPDQMVYIGDNNTMISSSYGVWIDLFGWGTGDYPTKYSINYSDYADYYVDWGINKIGKDNPNTWRTLAGLEWKYLLTERPNADKLNGAVRIDLEDGSSVVGWVLLPDAWVCPTGLTFTAGSTGKYSTNEFLLDEWKALEASGAVFLPAAGRRDGTYVDCVQYAGYYWSDHQWHNSYSAPCLSFYSDEVICDDFTLYTGLSVRLVKDL